MYTDSNAERDFARDLQTDLPQDSYTVRQGNRRIPTPSWCARASMHDMELSGCPAVPSHAQARAYNNIPVDKCTEAGIVRVQHTRRQRQRRQGADAGTVFCWPRATSSAASNGSRTLKPGEAGRRQAGRKGQEPVCRPGNSGQDAGRDGSGRNRRARGQRGGDAWA